MKRIIAFDGFDCTGKTTLIKELEVCLKINGLNVYTFHLTGPSSRVFGVGENNYFTDANLAVFQWSKFEQLFETIRTILSVDDKAMIILDRTPFTENIWQEFFDRDFFAFNYEPAELLENFCNTFSDLLNKMLFVNLNIETTELVERIYNRKVDRDNYLAAFDRFIKPTKTFDMFYFPELDKLNNKSDKEKLETVLDFLDKEYFAPLFYELYENYNVKFINVENNSKENMMKKLKFIVNNLV